MLYLHIRIYGLTQAALPIVDTLSALSDPVRCRMVWLLDHQELTVSELCDVLQLPQSTVSRQLKTLFDAGWVTSRREGTSRYYSRTVQDVRSAADEIWRVTRVEMDGRTGADQDRRRLARVLAGRQQTSREFFATAAGKWDRLRDDLFGANVAVRALPALLPPDWVVADLGCGTGALVAAVAPHVARVIGVDASDEMLGAARARVGHAANVEWRTGTLEALPLESASLDAATMMLVWHHLSSPATALNEARRVLKPGGRLLVVDMLPHDREEYRAQMGHVWLGFAEEHARRLLSAAGFDRIRVHALPPTPEAKGPSLFAAVASRAAKESPGHVRSSNFEV